MSRVFPPRLAGALVALGVAAAPAAGLAKAATALPTGPDWAASLARDLAPLARRDGEGQNAAARRPVRHTRVLHVPADGRTDATIALQVALDALTDGGTLVLDRGDYRQVDCLVIRHARVRMIGRSARLLGVGDRACIVVEGDDVEVRGLTLTTARPVRRSDPETARILVRGQRARIANNQIEGAASVGIFVDGARDFTIVANDVRATLADGIHITGGASGGYIGRNTVQATGDDGIAVVSYLDQPPCTRILITHNRISDIRNARGIAVVGGSDIVIRANTITGTGRAAGILVAREAVWRTHGAERVVIASNTVSQVARRFDVPAALQTGHGSIDLNADAASEPELRVRRILITDNTLIDGGTAGVRLLGAVCEVDLRANRIHRMAGGAIALAEPRCGEPLASCADNQVDEPGTLPSVCRPAPQRSSNP